VCCEGLGVSGLDFRGPSPEGIRAGSAEPGGPFAAAHLGVVLLGADGGSVVVHEDHQRVLGDSELIEAGEQLADVRVDIFDHPVKVFEFVVDLQGGKTGCILGFGVVGVVGCVGGEPAEEGLFVGSRLHRADPFLGSIKEHIGAVSLGLFKGPIVQNGWVEIAVSGGVPAASWEGLPDAAGPVDEGLIETSSVGLVGVFVAEVPFSKDAGLVPRLLEDLGDRDGIESESFAFEDGVGHAVEELVSTGHQSRSGRRAGG